MQINKKKFEIALAREKKSAADLRKVVSPQVLTRIRNIPNYEVTTKTAGKIAEALKVDVTEIIRTEE